MLKCLIALIFAAAAVITTPAAAQIYPSRPITIVVPFAAGGAFDAIARILSEHMKMSPGQPVIIEHMSGGATGSTGVGWVAALEARKYHVFEMILAATGYRRM